MPVANASTSFVYKGVWLTTAFANEPNSYRWNDINDCKPCYLNIFAFLLQLFKQGLSMFRPRIGLFTL